jgi:hypothetical protein
VIDESSPIALPLEEAQRILSESDALAPTGFEDCLIGVIERCGEGFFGAYDVGKVIEKLKSQGMTHEEALDWFHVNMAGAWVGMGTPAWFHRISE